MKVVAVTSQKGGTGKTTLSGHLAVQAERSSIAALSADLARLGEAGIKLVIIDTPPAITWTIVEVIKVSDLVVIPVRPSPHDLAAAGSTVDLVEDLGKPMVFVINSASQRARITGEAAVALSQHGTVAPTTVHNRTDFAASMIDGRTVMEIARARRSAEEIESLWQYLARRLARLSQDSAQRSLPLAASEKDAYRAPELHEGVA